LHAAALDFLTRMKDKYPASFVGKILECGSLDVNGNPRGFFRATEYVGIDWRHGPGVDEVSLIHEYRGRPDGYFNTVISTEALEHDPYWEASIERMVQLLGEGGSLIITCAGPGRPAHSHESSQKAGYYGNVGLAKLRHMILRAATFGTMHGENDTTHCDTRLFALGKAPK
jgi:hypothetical protein